MDQEGDPSPLIGSSGSANRYPDKLDSDPLAGHRPQSRTDTTRSVETCWPVFSKIISSRNLSSLIWDLIGRHFVECLSPGTQSGLPVRDVEEISFLTQVNFLINLQFSDFKKQTSLLSGNHIMKTNKKFAGQLGLNKITSLEMLTPNFYRGTDLC